MDVPQQIVEEPKVLPVHQNMLENGDQIAVRGLVKDLSPWLVPIMAHTDGTDGTDGTYLHHGIYLKEEMNVIEFQGEDKKSAKPKIRSLTKFVAGSVDAEIYRVQHKKSDCLPVDETIRLGREAVRKAGSWERYNLIFNNCETFATFLKTGKEMSMQVQKVMLATLEKLAPVVNKGIASSSALSVDIASSIGITKK